MLTHIRNFSCDAVFVSSRTLAGIIINEICNDSLNK